MNINYEKLNQILKKSVSSKGIAFWLNEMSLFYLKNTYELSLVDDSFFLDTQDCFTIIYDFLSTISLKSANAFYLFYTEIKKEENKNCVDENGNIWVDLKEKNNFRTLANLAHESIHKLPRRLVSFFI